MLEVVDASVVLGKSRILHYLSLQFEVGQLTVIAGPNGAGKSTLMKVLTGELRPVSGNASLDGRSISAYAPHELAGRRAVLPQSSQLAFPFTVFEVVRLGFSTTRVSRVEQDSIVLEMLNRVDLGRHADRFYHELSGGEQQRVQLARVLSQLAGGDGKEGSRYLLLDEPTSSLDIRHQLQILDIARDYARNDTGVVAVLHDLNISAVYADRLIILRDGECLADGPPADIMTSELLLKAFDVPLKVNSVPEGEGPFVLPQSAL